MKYSKSKERIDCKKCSLEKQVRWEIKNKQTNKQNRNQICTNIQYKPDKNQEINPCIACGCLHLKKYCPFNLDT